MIGHCFWPAFVFLSCCGVLWEASRIRRIGWRAWVLWWLARTAAYSGIAWAVFLAFWAR